MREIYKKILSVIKRPQLVFIKIFKCRLRILSDEIYLRLMYRLHTGKKPDISDPKTYTEKLQWLKLNDRNPVYNKYADKYAVRSHIAQTIGEQYLIPLIGVFDSAEDIKWDLLPDKFVLKCTHGSGMNIICTDKSRLDIKASAARLKKWMKQNFYWPGREWPYKNVKPRIICEEFLSSNGNIPEDYKVMCFHGKAKLIQVHLNRFGDKHTCDYYDTDWNKTDIADEPNSDIVLAKPKLLDKMIELSEILSKNICHVRIDWYIVGDKLFFGEITLYDGSGFNRYYKIEDDLLMGSWINTDA